MVDSALQNMKTALSLVRSLQVIEGTDRDYVERLLEDAVAILERLTQRLPDVVAHADWGCDPCSRWIARATLRPGHVYEAHAPEPVGPLDELIPKLREEAGEQACILLGFDFPIGLPAFYAKQVGISNFKTGLMQFGKGDWAEFFNVAEQAAEIALRRPFYPLKSGKKGEHKQESLLTVLGATRLDDLLRRCERSHNGRPAAACLFWTLGPKTVGKAAICGWRDVIIPALNVA